MDRKILIDGHHGNETRVALLNKNGMLEDFKYSTDKNPIQGNIYLAKVVKVEPALQAAFIVYAKDKSGFLPFSEIHPDYYDNQGKNSNKNKLRLTNIPLPEVTDLELSDHRIKSLDQEPSEPVSIVDIGDNAELSQVNIEVADSDIETISDDKGEEAKGQKAYKIQEVIKKGQVLLVQAQKEERGSKAAYFSTYISLTGKYSILLANQAKHNGISRRIADADERWRLKNIISQLLIKDQSPASIIIRTSGLNRSAYDIKRDYEYLVRLWNRITEAANQAAAVPTFIHMEEDIIQKAIRDLFDHTIDEVIIQGREAYQKATEFMSNILGMSIDKVQEYRNAVPLFSQYNIEEQITQLYQPTIALPSGGYIVVNPTEALISIDVNSGKSTSESNIEETAFKTNLEATKEIARQLKFRDISGLIVIDFIDMYENKHRRAVERSLKGYLSSDKAKMQIGNISNFGLLEMSRQRLRSSFLENHTIMCHHCNGKGLVRSSQANSMVILRTIENELATGKADIVNVLANQEAVIYLNNNYRQELQNIEQKHKIKLNLQIDPSLSIESFAIEKMVTPKTKIIVEDLQPAIIAKEALSQDNTQPSLERKMIKRDHRRGRDNARDGYNHRSDKRKFVNKGKATDQEKKPVQKSSFLRKLINKIVS